MMPMHPLLAFACSLLPLAVFQQSQQVTPDPARPGLQRVAPGVDPHAAPGLADAFGREFKRADWIERLRASDLEQRERAYDALIKRARMDPVARGFLEELARDPSGGEASWTARLALRELGRASFPLQGRSPLGSPFARSNRMEQMMQSLLSEDGGGLLLLPHVGGTDGNGSTQKRFHIEQGPDGARIHVTEIQGGVETPREYAGRDLAEIFRSYPELQQELGGGLHLQVQPGTPFDMQFGLGGDALLQRLLGTPDGDHRLAPQGRSRPILTGKLGVIARPRANDGGAKKGERGLLVERSYPESYAFLLGVRAGDVLLELNGKELTTSADIEEAMNARGLDDPLTLVWLDDLGQRQEKTWRPDEGK